MTIKELLLAIGVDIKAALYYTRDAYNFAEATNRIQAASDILNEIIKTIDRPIENVGRRIFATGVFLVPYQLPGGNWIWISDGFEDSSFINGTECDPVHSAETMEGLLKDTEA